MAKEMSFEQAKKEVAGYIKKKGTAATDELAENLHLDIRTLIDVLNELQNEGHIRERRANQGDEKIMRAVQYPESIETMTPKEVYNRDADPDPEKTDEVVRNLSKIYTKEELRNIALLLLK